MKFLEAAERAEDSSQERGDLYFYCIVMFNDTSV